MFKGKWNCLGSFTCVVFIWIFCLIQQQTLSELSFAIFLKFAGVCVQTWEVVAGLASRGAGRSTVGVCGIFVPALCRGGGTP
jgi:hypothetical protein